MALLEKNAPRLGEASEILTAAELRSFREGEGESLRGQCSGGRKQVRPCALPILAVGELQTLDCAGNTRGAIAGDAVLSRLARGIEIHITRGGGGRALAEIQERGSTVGKAGKQES